MVQLEARFLPIRKNHKYVSKPRSKHSGTANRFVYFLWRPESIRPTCIRHSGWCVFWFILFPRGLMLRIIPIHPCIHQVNRKGLHAFLLFRFVWPIGLFAVNAQHVVWLTWLSFRSMWLTAHIVIIHLEVQDGCHHGMVGCAIVLAKALQVLAPARLHFGCLALCHGFDIGAYHTNGLRDLSDPSACQGGRTTYATFHRKTAFSRNS
jgi:hypothetical protein